MDQRELGAMGAALREATTARRTSHRRMWLVGVVTGARWICVDSGASLEGSKRPSWLVRADKGVVASTAQKAPASLRKGAAHSRVMPGSKLLARILDISEKAQLSAVAVSFHDYQTSLRFSYQGSLVFHAASTIKAAILFALFKASESGKVR